MSEPKFLEPEEVIELHDAAIEAYGGSLGLRDHGGLISAAHAPRNHWYYTGGDLFDLAAVLLIHLARNHPFVDGNKRAALVSALTFLDAHGETLVVDADRMEELTLLAAQGKMDAESLAAALRTMKMDD
ncbi:MAG: type II toxin-antitoxin system death-on-curing family toxin [Acidobacteria bacterium]|nr:type II toxin-antitoxin system death-on-curing family toxin [Acidobacteriota bacterium]